MANETEIKYLTPIAVETQRKKYCRFKKSGIKYIDYKDADFLLKFVNEQGKILPRRDTSWGLLSCLLWRCREDRPRKHAFQRVCSFP